MNILKRLTNEQGKTCSTSIQSVHDAEQDGLRDGFSSFQYLIVFIVRVVACSRAMMRVYEIKFELPSLVVERLCANNFCTNAHAILPNDNVPNRFAI